MTHEPDVEIRRQTIWSDTMVQVFCRHCGAILRDRLERQDGFRQWVRPLNDQCWGRAATAAAEEHELD